MFDRGGNALSLSALGILFALYLLGQGLFVGAFQFADTALNLFLSFAGILLLLGLGLGLLRGMNAVAPAKLGFWTVHSKWIAVAPFAALLLLLLITLLGLLISTAGKAALDQYTSELAADETGLQFILTLMTLALLAPLIEEFLFRGALFTAVAERMDLISAFLISSLLFAMLHVGTLAVMASWFDQLIVIASLTLVGLFAAGLRHASGSLLPAIFMHGIYNAFVFMISS